MVNKVFSLSPSLLTFEAWYYSLTIHHWPFTIHVQPFAKITKKPSRGNGRAFSFVFQTSGEVS